MHDSAWRRASWLFLLALFATPVCVYVHNTYLGAFAFRGPGAAAPLARPQGRAAQMVGELAEDEEGDHGVIEDRQQMELIAVPANEPSNEESER